MKIIKMLLEVAEKNYEEIQKEEDKIRKIGRLEGLVEFTLEHLRKEVEANV